jgi:hypothetical protein
VALPSPLPPMIRLAPLPQRVLQKNWKLLMLTFSFSPSSLARTLPCPRESIMRDRGDRRIRQTGRQHPDNRLVPASASHTLLAMTERLPLSSASEITYTIRIPSSGSIGCR